MNEETKLRFNSNVPDHVKPFIDQPGKTRDEIARLKRQLETLERRLSGEEALALQMASVYDIKPVFAELARRIVFETNFGANWFTPSELRDECLRKYPDADYSQSLAYGFCYRNHEDKKLVKVKPESGKEFKFKIGTSQV